MQITSFILNIYICITIIVVALGIVYFIMWVDLYRQDSFIMKLLFWKWKIKNKIAKKSFE